MFCLTKAFAAVVLEGLGSTGGVERGRLQLEPHRRACDSTMTSLPFNLGLDLFPESEMV